MTPRDNKIIITKSRIKEVTKGETWRAQNKKLALNTVYLSKSNYKGCVRILYYTNVKSRNLTIHGTLSCLVKIDPVFGCAPTLTNWRFMVGKYIKVNFDNFIWSQFNTEDGRQAFNGEFKKTQHIKPKVN
jgi:hypothetical protein